MSIDHFRVAMPCEKSAADLTSHFQAQGANPHHNKSANEVLIVAGRSVTEDSVYKAAEAFSVSGSASVGLYDAKGQEEDRVEIGANRIHSQHFGRSFG